MYGTARLRWEAENEFSRKARKAKGLNIWEAGPVKFHRSVGQIDAAANDGRCGSWAPPLRWSGSIENGRFVLINF